MLFFSFYYAFSKYSFPCLLVLLLVVLLLLFYLQFRLLLTLLSTPVIVNVIDMILWEKCIILHGTSVRQHHPVSKAQRLPSYPCWSDAVPSTYLSSPTTPQCPQYSMPHISLRVSKWKGISFVFCAAPKGGFLKKIISFHLIWEYEVDEIVKV